MPFLMRPANSLAVTILLTALVALGPISTDLYLPSLPGMARAFGGDVDQVQLTLSLFLAGFAVGQLVYGPLSDRFGRRPVLLAGVALFVIATAVCALAPSLPMLIASRFVQALGACAGPVIGRAVVRDVYGREGAARVLAYMSAAIALAPAIGPIIGGFLEIWFGWRANFVALLVFGIAGLAGAYAILPETNRDPDPRAAMPVAILSTFGMLLRNRAFLGYMLCYTAGYGTLFAFISGSSFVFIEAVGLAPEQFGFCFAFMVVGYIAGAVLSGRLIRKQGLDRLIAAGGIIAAAAGAALAGIGWSGMALEGLEGAMLLLVPAAIVAFGIGLVMANAMVGAISPFPRAAGSAAALVGFVQMSGAALLGLAVGYFYDGTPRAMTGAMALATFAIPLAVILLRANAGAGRSAAG